MIGRISQMYQTSACVRKGKLHTKNGSMTSSVAYCLLACCRKPNDATMIPMRLEIGGFNGSTGASTRTVVSGKTEKPGNVSWGRWALGDNIQAWMLDKQVAGAGHPHNMESCAGFGTLIKEMMGVTTHSTGGLKMVMQAAGLGHGCPFAYTTRANRPAGRKQGWIAPQHDRTKEKSCVKMQRARSRTYLGTMKALSRSRHRGATIQCRLNCFERGSLADGFLSKS